jgi:hypothetical protein
MRGMVPNSSKSFRISTKSRVDRSVRAGGRHLVAAKKFATHKTEV